MTRSANLATVLDVPTSVRVLADHGVLEPIAVHTAARLAALHGCDDEREVLATALAVRAPTRGHVALDLSTVGELLRLDELAGLADDDRARLEQALDACVTHVRAGRWTSPTLLRDVAQLREVDRVAPLVVAGDLVYLDRWLAVEDDVGTAVLARLDPVGPGPPPGVVAHVDDGASGRSPTDLDAVLDRVFAGGTGTPAQRRAAQESLARRLVVLAGGPGTGKTWTVARILATHLAHATDREPTIALAAPTGKAAARLSEGVEEALASGGIPADVGERVARSAHAGTTLHRLLGLRPGGRPRHGPHDPLPHDLVVVDEASMVALPLMRLLLAALRPSAHLVLVGDPDQLASVEAGTVLGDVVSALASVDHPSLVELQRIHRFAENSGIARLATAVRAGDVDATRAVFHDAEDVTLVPNSDVGREVVREVVVSRGRALVDAARAGDVEGAVGALSSAVVLAAHRRGRLGVERCNQHAEDWLARSGIGWRPWDHHQVGRPLLVTANDARLGIFNGDLGVYVAMPDGRVRAAFDLPDVDGVPTTVHPDRLPDHDPVHAMTIHKSQGSQWDRVVVVLPDHPSPLLTRELLYTAITRARRSVTVIGDEEVLAATVGARVRRSSGLRGRLVRGLRRPAPVS